MEMIKRWRVFEMLKREQRMEVSSKVYRECAEKIAKTGKAPTVRLIKKEIAGTSVIRIIKKKDRQICKNICREVRDSFLPR